VDGHVPVTATAGLTRGTSKGESCDNNRERREGGQDNGGSGEEARVNHAAAVVSAGRAGKVVAVVSVGQGAAEARVVRTGQATAAARQAKRRQRRGRSTQQQHRQRATPLQQRASVRGVMWARQRWQCMCRPCGGSGEDRVCGGRERWEAAT
jgi:hypothetical protein